MAGAATRQKQVSERLVTAEIHPLFVLPAGQGVKAADAVTVLAST